MLPTYFYKYLGWNGIKEKIYSRQSMLYFSLFMAVSLEAYY